jgi:predicted Abi (CAAX) family protease
MTMSATPNIPPVVPETPEPSAAAMPVLNKRTVATGAIPKQMQSWIFLGIIAVVAIGLWFSGMGKKAKSTTGTGSATAG